MASERCRNASETNHSDPLLHELHVYVPAIVLGDILMRLPGYSEPSE